MVTWNGARYLPVGLKSLKSQTYKNWRLLVIDNGSTDATVEIVKETVPAALIIANKENQGFAPSHNEAIRRTESRYILMLNQDVVLAENFLGRAVDYLERHPRVAALQPKLGRYDFKAGRPLGIIDTTGLVMYKNRRIVNRGQGQPDKDQFGEGEIFGADGAAPVYRRSALEDVKLPLAGQAKFEYLDEDFFSYKEDVDLAWRLRLAGWSAVYVPQVQAWHGRGSGDAASTKPVEIVKERRKISAFAKTLSWRNQRLMQIKNEQGLVLFRHWPWLCLKEMAAWAYILLFEPATVRSLPAFFKLVPRAFRKRGFIQAKTRVSARSMLKWFT